MILFCLTFMSVSKMASAESLSILLVLSSRIHILLSWSIIRAMNTRCFSPPDRFAPLSMIKESQSLFLKIGASSVEFLSASFFYSEIG